MAAVSRPFAYNSGLAPISGAYQVINSPLAIGVDPQDYTLMPGGIQWWEGPDENVGYVIAHSVPTGTQPNPLGIPAYVGFWRSSNLTENAFVTKAGFVSNKSYQSGDEAYIWMNGLGYWSSWPVTPGSLTFPNGGDLKFPAIVLNSDFTIEFWYRGNATSTGQPQTIFGQNSTGSGHDLWLTIDNSTKCLFGLSSPGAPISTPIPASTWVHVAITCQSGTLTVYFDGNDVTSPGLPGCSLSNGGDDIYIGSLLGTNKFLDAELTNIRFTISAIYQNGFSVPKGPLLPIQDTNPYGGTNTSAISDGECVFLLDSLSSSTFDQDLSNLNTPINNNGVSYSSNNPF